MNTTKKLAIVTGGGSGIGFAIATQFVQHNIYTVIVGRDEQKLRNACEQLGPGSECYTCDLSDLNAIPVMVDMIISRYGHIDILVNNAGINMKKSFTEVTDEEFQDILQTNVTAVFALSREVVKHQLEKKISGCLINISSMASQYGIPKVIAYTASKSAIEGMTKAMATELSPYGIRINCIAPGFIATDMSAKALESDPERKAKALGRTPLGYLGRPADIGAAALFLASDAAQYITGVVLPVDGGNAIGF
ncbi:SDR family NAD(P)-dependent oxidoreductase [Chitinophaga pinensis]|uniref:Short-chain dehydrogenase/reductase SDR n=1 Tax=Chitinophaga pinensis (strain ATCC 43595 / DSM 2588 / LMG 13176 / NBRC 15968 / NCIMB 11800 / UQM 2034) TaxID=485918 RepID=A0A979G7N4_CHIPD|nr:SDR family oxidoreductase [Chitinophaga pinensis]ACU62276.1 short-chain dehydrogenase/reductase SDR [Chitinophaga pinensis DSM 2588]